MKLPVPCFLAVTHLGLIPENNDLLAFTLSLRGSNYFRSLDSGITYCYLVAISDKQYPVQLNSATLGHIQTFHINNQTGSHFILFAASFNNSVNLQPPEPWNFTSYCGSMSNKDLEIIMMAMERVVQNPPVTLVELSQLEVDNTTDLNSVEHLFGFKPLALS